MSNAGRLLEDGTFRLLEDDVSLRSLEFAQAVVVQSTDYGNPSTQYIQNEQPYLRCNVCNRKAYQVAYAGMICNAWNSAPSLYPLQYCPGVLVPSTMAVIPQLDFQLVLQERANT